MSAAKRVIYAPGWSSWEVIFDQTGRQKEIARLEEEAAQPDLWTDSAKAQVVLQSLSKLKEAVGPYLAL